MKALHRGVACAELFNKKFKVPEHKTRTFEKTPEEIKKALKIEEDRKRYLDNQQKKENKERIINGRNKSWRAKSCRYKHRKTR